MAALTGREHRSQSRAETTRENLARRRRNLLLPILLLVAVALCAVSGLLYWSAVSANQRDAVAQDDLIRSFVQLRKDGLRQLVIDYAWWDDAVSSLGTEMDERWARERLPAYLESAFQVTAGWIVAPDDKIIYSFEDGESIPPARAPMLPSGAASLIAAARAATSLDDVPGTGFVMHRQDLALLGASIISPLEHVDRRVSQGNVLVFAQTMDLTLFARAGTGEHIQNLHFIRGSVPPGYLGCVVNGLEGQQLGAFVWRNQRVGDDLLWSMVPLLLIALTAVGILLYLAVRRVDMVVSHEGRLSISLYQEQQRRSQKSNFVSMVSHELRTPLQAIGAAADMLERFGDQMNEAERREEARTIRRAVGTLARLVDDVLVIGRAEAAGLRNGEEPLDLGRFCGAVWREVSVALRSKQELVLTDDIRDPVHGLNDVALHTILSNLMQNAIKYSRGVGDIEIDLRRDGGGYVIAVTDGGPGIAPSEREAIFQPYWRSSLVGGIAGTGLGLPVARSAARSLGGDLVVEEGGAGRGARFVVRLPAAE